MNVIEMLKNNKAIVKKVLIGLAIGAAAVAAVVIVKNRKNQELETEGSEESTGEFNPEA
jgi:hypothetical protein